MLNDLLGPHHRPQGEPDQYWTQDHILDPAWLVDEEERRAHWTDDYFFLRYGFPDGARIRYATYSAGEKEAR